MPVTSAPCPCGLRSRRWSPVRLTGPSKCGIFALSSARKHSSGTRLMSIQSTWDELLKRHILLLKFNVIYFASLFLLGLILFLVPRTRQPASGTCVQTNRCAHLLSTRKKKCLIAKFEHCQVCIYRPPTANSSLTCCGVSISGRILLAGSDDSTVHMWDVLKAQHYGLQIDPKSYVQRIITVSLIRQFAWTRKPNHRPVSGTDRARHCHIIVGQLGPHLGLITKPTSNNDCLIIIWIYLVNKLLPKYFHYGVVPVQLEKKNNCRESSATATWWRVPIFPAWHTKLLIDVSLNRIYQTLVLVSLNIK